jgi:sensor histidine kinase regulating citrate/malate metabolism
LKQFKKSLIEFEWEYLIVAVVVIMMGICNAAVWHRRVQKDAFSFWK